MAETKNIKIGTSNIDIKLGETQISEVYVGSNLVWEHGIPLPQLDTPTNLTADGTTISFDEVENAESYEVFADGVSIGEYTPEPELQSETWFINDSGLNYDGSDDTTISINFSSNAENYSAITIGHGIGGVNINYDDTLVRNAKTGGWIDQAYRTITFETAPTGDLLTWLENNAVKQEDTPQVSIDLTTLSGWPLLIGGNHTITVKAKATGYRNSAASEGVTITKPSTSETWIINEEPNLSGSGRIEVDINFTSNNITFNRISIVKSTIYLSRKIQYGATIVYGPTWDANVYRTITFETAPTGELLAWLQANAVKQ